MSVLSLLLSLLSVLLVVRLLLLLLLRLLLMLLLPLLQGGTLHCRPLHCRLLHLLCVLRLLRLLLLRLLLLHLVLLHLVLLYLVLLLLRLLLRDRLLHVALAGAGGGLRAMEGYPQRSFARGQELVILLQEVSLSCVIVDPQHQPRRERARAVVCRNELPQVGARPEALRDFEGHQAPVGLIELADLDGAHRGLALIGRLTRRCVRGHGRRCRPRDDRGLGGEEEPTWFSRK